jgi:hypothetical protein
MVRAGVMNHPGEWNESGFAEIQKPPRALRHHRLTDFKRVVRLLKIFVIFKKHSASGGSKGWRTPGVAVMKGGWNRSRLEVWRLLRASRSSLVSRSHIELWIEANGSYALREPAEAYGLNFAAENEALRSQNTSYGMKG